MNTVLKRNIKRALKLFPTAKIIAKDAIKGQEKLGWYLRAYNKINAIYKEDTKLFAGLLAATSPRQHVKLNYKMAKMIYQKYIEKDRPKDNKSISYLAKYGDLNARIQNIKRVFKNEPLSGNKVSSFYQNLIGNLNAVTIDTWIITYIGIQHQQLIESKGGYLALSHRIKQASRILNWKPAEVQECLWSYTYAIVNKCRIEDVPEYSID